MWSKLELYLKGYNFIIEAYHRHKYSSSFSPSLSESYIAGRSILPPVSHNASLLATLSIAIACTSYPRNRAAYSISHSLPAFGLVLASLISIYNRVGGKPDCSSQCGFNIPSPARRIASLFLLMDAVPATWEALSLPSFS